MASNNRNVFSVGSRGRDCAPSGGFRGEFTLPFPTAGGSWLPGTWGFVLTLPPPPLSLTKTFIIGFRVHSGDQGRSHLKSLNFIASQRAFFQIIQRFQEFGCGSIWEGGTFSAGHLLMERCVVWINTDLRFSMMRLKHFLKNKHLVVSISSCLTGYLTSLDLFLHL